jgi:hypothetical protein
MKHAEIWHRNDQEVLSVWDLKAVQKCLFKILNLFDMHAPILACQRSKILQGLQEQCKSMLFTSINAYGKSSSSRGLCKLIVQSAYIEERERQTAGGKICQGDEVQIALHLSSTQMCSNPQNRMVPILEAIPIHSHIEEVFLIMPFLCKFPSPLFHCGAEFVEANEQADSMIT